MRDASTPVAEVGSTDGLVEEEAQTRVERHFPSLTVASRCPSFVPEAPPTSSDQQLWIQFGGCKQACVFSPVVTNGKQDRPRFVMVAGFGRSRRPKRLRILRRVSCFLGKSCVRATRQPAALGKLLYSNTAWHELNTAVSGYSRHAFGGVHRPVASTTRDLFESEQKSNTDFSV